MITPRPQDFLLQGHADGDAGGAAASRYWAAQTSLRSCSARVYSSGDGFSDAVFLIGDDLRLQGAARFFRLKIIVLSAADSFPVEGGGWGLLQQTAVVE